MSENVDIRQASNVLVRSTNWVGDAVLTLPALRALRGALPRARVTVLARPWVSAIFEREPAVDRVLIYPSRSNLLGMRTGWWRMGRSLRGEHFDAALLFQNAFEAALIARLAAIPLRAGYAREGRGFLLTHAAPVPHAGEIPAHECYYYLELLRRLGLIAELPPVRHILLAEPPSRQAAREKLAAITGISVRSAPVVGLSPGAAFGTAKRWLPGRYAEVGRALVGDGARIVLFGSQSESELAGRIAGEIGPAARSLAGRTTLAEFIDTVAACDLFLTNDSGAMHLAAAAGVPVLAVFGPTDERGTAPLGPGARILRKQVECAPCKLRECPIDHRCMTGVDTAGVLAVAREMLQSSVPGAAQLL